MEGIRYSDSNSVSSSFLGSPTTSSLRLQDEVIDEINESKNRNRMMKYHFGDMIPSDQICIAGIS
jgi:hypothetical protein